jgi:hypothetical protein
MKIQCLFFLIFLSFSTVSSSQTPIDAPLPSKFDGLSATLLVNHFPATVYASEDENEKSKYQWKHTTSVMSTNSDIQITDFGAYIFYNKQWNLRVSMNKKDFAKLFGGKKGKMKKGQPYTFKDNWRHDNRLLGGWAMWYFIGTNDKGETVYGIGKLETVGELVQNSNKCKAGKTAQ